MAGSISLTRYLVEQQRIQSLIPSDLRLLFEVVARACKSISQAVNKGALGGVLGSAHSVNVQGEVQKKLDITPTQLQQRVSVVLGGRNEVERITGYHAGL